FGTPAAARISLRPTAEKPLPSKMGMAVSRMCCRTSTAAAAFMGWHVTERLDQSSSNLTWSVMALRSASDPLPIPFSGKHLREASLTSRPLLCYGDSNTHGTKPLSVPGVLERFDPADRWPGVLREALGPGWTIVEEGLPARTTVHDDPIEGRHKNGLAY